MNIKIKFSSLVDLFLMKYHEIFDDILINQIKN